MQMPAIDPQGVLPVTAVRTRTCAQGTSIDSLLESFIKGGAEGPGDSASEHDAVPRKIFASPSKPGPRQSPHPEEVSADQGPAATAEHNSASPSQPDQPQDAAAPESLQTQVGADPSLPADSALQESSPVMPTVVVNPTVALLLATGTEAMVTMTAPAMGEGQAGAAGACLTQVETAQVMAPAWQDTGMTLAAVPLAVATGENGARIVQGEDGQSAVPSAAPTGEVKSFSLPVSRTISLEPGMPGQQETAGMDLPLVEQMQDVQETAPGLPAKGNQAAETMDPRFAELLGKPAEAESLADAASRQAPVNRRPASQGLNLARAVAAKLAGQQPAPQAIDANLHENHLEGQGEKAQIAAAAPEPAQATTTADTGTFFSTIGAVTNQTATQPILTNQDNGAIRLPAGTLIPEHRVIEQVVGQVALRSFGNGASSITIRLQPEELGRLKMDLLVDKDSVRAHIQTQSAQVQEVLERYLPRLREGFELNGLRLEQIQVSVDAERKGGFGPFQDHLPSWSTFRTPAPAGRVRAPEDITIGPVLMGRTSSGGINLRV